MKRILKISVGALTIASLLIGASLFSISLSDGVSAAKIKNFTLESYKDFSSCTFEYQMTMNSNSEYNGETYTMDMTMDGNGAIDITNKQLMMKMDIKGNAESSGSTMMELEDSQINTNAECYFMDNIMYMKMEYLETEQWIKMDFSGNDVFEESLSDSVWDSYDQMGMSQELLEISEVKRLPDETINGVECHVLKLIPNINELYETMMNQQSLGSYGSTSSMGYMDISSMVEDFSVKLWSAKDTNYIMRILMKISIDMHMFGASSSADMEMSIQFSDHNEPINIELPEEAENALTFEDMFEDISSEDGFTELGEPQSHTYF
jgi:hypothetical protein